MSAIHSNPTTTNEIAWDGLRDEQAPIPAIGPALRDAEGHWIIDDDEWQARAEATRIALSRWENRADDDEPPETDKEFMKAIDAERPHRPLFDGLS